MKVLLMLIALVWLPFTNTPQTKYQFLTNSKISIAGTSTLHDWTMDSDKVTGEADIEVSGNQILSISDVKLEIPVESLKSGKSAMDKNAYEALKSGKHPKISFKLKGFEPIAATGGTSVLEVNGHLTIAGKTRPETILVKYRTDKAGNLLITGSKELKMTDYGVTPPEVMFGSVKTGNDITITFNLHLQQAQSL